MSTDIDVRDIKWSNMNKFKLMSYTIFGQITLRIFTHPLNVLQTNMQTVKTKLKFRETARKIWLTEGIKGFYKGAGVSLMAIPSGQIYLVTMEYLNDKLHNMTNFQSFSRGISGSLASCLSGLYAVPFDIVSQRKIMSKHTIKEIVTSLYKAEGMRGFYRGYYASMLVSFPSSGLFWFLYSKIIKFVVKPKEYDVLTTATPKELLKDIPKLVVSALTSVYIVTFLNNPLSVIRTRIQVLDDSKGIIKEAKNIYYKEGVLAFFKGLTPRLIGSTIFITLFVGLYETVKRLSIHIP